MEEQYRSSIGRLVYSDERLMWRLPVRLVIPADVTPLPTVQMWDVRASAAVFHLVMSEFFSLLQLQVQGQSPGFQVPWSL